MRRLFTPLVLLLGLTAASPSFPEAPAAGPPSVLTTDQGQVLPTGTPPGLSTVDWAEISAQIEASRYAAQPTDAGLEAANPGQQWRTAFDGRGFLVEPQGADWRWGLELRGYGVGAEQRELSGPAHAQASGTRVSYDWDGTLEEWFVNDRRGLEHGFTLAARPQGEGDALELAFAVRGGLRPKVTDDGQAVSFLDDQGAEVLTYSGLKVTDAEGAEVTASFALEPDGLRLRVADQGARYPLTIDPIAQQAYLKASNPGVRDLFGAPVAVSGDTVVVGAPYEDSSDFVVNGDQADNSAPEAGAAYVFVRNGTTWTQQAYLKASNTDPNDIFGSAVAISGDTVVIGAIGEDSAALGVNGNQADNSSSGSGAVYVFVRNGIAWSQQAYLKPSNYSPGYSFGGAVTISGDTVGVGSNYSNAGAAYVFIRSGTTWTWQAFLRASSPYANDKFGFSAALSGDTLVVGAPGEDGLSSGSGAAYVFVRSGASWAQQAYLKESNPGAGDSFGYSVAISGDMVVVGAYGEDSNATGVNGNQSDNSAVDSGAAYVFGRHGTTWGQEAYLKASNTAASDNFGSAVAVSGDKVLVGADLEDSSSTGVNGNQADNSAANAGAAYLFTRIGPNWRQQSYLKATNSEAGDYFAGYIAMSGDTVVIGTLYESSSAPGVNGNQADNSMTNAGAAYVFTINTVGATTTSLASDRNPATLGDLIALTARVTPVEATGTVTFKDGATTLGTATLAAGSAAYSTDALTGGSHGLTAVYAGDTTYSGSTSATLTQSVKNPSSTAVVSGLNPADLGQSVSFTASVTPAAATGTLTFMDGATALGTATLSAGSASYSTAALAAGSHAITVVYGGDGIYNGSTSPALTQTVKAASTTTLVGTPNPSTPGQTVSLTASVTPAAATGTLTFMDGATTLGAATLAGGSATLGTAALTLGSHAITAVYGGDGTHSGSTSAVLSQTVQALTGVTVATDPAGLTIRVDGTDYSAPHTFSWMPGTNHSIAVTSPQTGAGGGYYAFTSWSDGGALAHGITVPAAAATYTAAFQPVVTTLSAAVTAKAGTLGGARTWTLTLTNNGSVPAAAARLTGLNLGVIGTCRPAVTTGFPVDLGDIPAGSAVAATVAVTFTGCGKLTKFNGTIGYSADGGAVTGLTPLQGVTQ